MSVHPFDTLDLERLRAAVDAIESELAKYEPDTHVLRKEILNQLSPLELRISEFLSDGRHEGFVYEEWETKEEVATKRQRRVIDLAEVRRRRSPADTEPEHAR